MVKKDNSFEIDFESYIREGEPDKKESIRKLNLHLPSKLY